MKNEKFKMQDTLMYAPTPRNHLNLLLIFTFEW